MKNILLTLTGVLGISGMASAGLVKQPVATDAITIVNSEKNLNQVTYESEGEYFYNYQIYISHNFVQAWEFTYNTGSETAFDIAVGGNLANFHSQTPLSFSVVKQLTKSLYQVWGKDKVASYDQKQGVIVKLEYDRFILENAIVSPQ